MKDHWRTLPDFIRVGSTGKVRGRDGELKIYLEDTYLEDVSKAAFLFIEVDGNKVPLQIEGFREVQDILVKFHGHDDPGAAEKWSSAPVYLPVDEVSSGKSLHKESSPDAETLSGYRIVDRAKGEVGVIREIVEYPQQEMAVVLYEGREVLIPLNDALIEHIEPVTQTIHMDLPDGLLEI